MTDEQAKGEEPDLDLEPETVKDLEVDEESAEDVPGGMVPRTSGCGGSPSRYC